MDHDKSLIGTIKKHLASKTTRLPVFNKTSLHIQQELNKTDPDFRQIERLISCDQALTGQVLKISNSAFYRGLKNISTVHDAILRVGLKEIANMVALATQKQNFKSSDPFVQERMNQLWKHSVGCAMGSQWLAKKCGFGDMSNKAFVSGLLHDIGKLFLLMVIESVRLSGNYNVSMSKNLVNETIANLHTEHGYSLMKNWNLLQDYCEIARDHHKEEYDGNNALLSIVRLADKTCNKIGLGFSEKPQILLAASLEATLLGLSEVSIAELEIKLEDSNILAA